MADKTMGAFKTFFKSIGDSIRAKKYLGILHGNLPKKGSAWSDGSFLTANEISLYTNRAIAKRAEKVGEIEFILRKRKGGDLIENDPLVDLLYKPNKVFNGRQFWALYQKYFDLCGEAYILLVGEREIFEKGTKITEMHILRPDLVEKKFGEDGMIASYDYKLPNKTVSYKPEQILYIHNPDPKSPLNGQSLLKAGIAAIQTEAQISTYHASVLENGGRVEGVFKFKTPAMSEEKLKDVKDQYKKEYAEAKNGGTPLFMGGDSEYQNVGLTPAELGYTEAKKMTLEDICMLTGVPKAVLGSMDDVQYSNADVSIKIFLRETIRPLMQTLTTALDERLFPDDRELSFIDPTPENVEEKLKQTESGMKNYYMTINEARERHGLDPISDGDDIMVPFNMMPLGTDLGLTETESKALREKIMGRIKAEKKEHPLKDADVREVYGRMQVKRMDAREKPFIKELKRYFNDQRDRLVTSLEPTKTRVYRKQGLFDELLQIELEVKLGKESFIPILTQLLKDAGTDAMELAGSDYDFHLTAEIGNWVDSRSDVFLRKINETTFKELRTQFEESFAAGESRDKLVNRIKDTYGDITKARAQLIARTEVHNATQTGTMEGYKQAGLVTKIWVTVGDAHVRQTHAEQDGEERPINMAFSNGLMYPGDPRGSAEEIINCRCVI